MMRHLSYWIETGNLIPSYRLNYPCFEPCPDVCASVFPVLAPYIYPCTLVAQHCSLFTTVAVAGERYLQSCHPHK